MQTETHTENTTDATRGQLIGERVLSRKAELEAALDDLGDNDRIQREALETAIATVEELITGDLDHPAMATGVAMNNWLEHNKHLAGGDVPTGGDKRKPPRPPQKDKADKSPQRQPQRAPKDDDDDRDVDVDKLNDGDARGPGPLPGDEDRLAHIPGDLLEK